MPKTKKSVDSTPKPKIPLPSLKPCPICGGEAKNRQNRRGEECYSSVYCTKCGSGTITRRPKPGESRRENKIASRNEWNNRIIYPPEELKKLNEKASRMYKKAKKAEKKAKRNQTI